MIEYFSIILLGALFTLCFMFAYESVEKAVKFDFSSVGFQLRSYISDNRSVLAMTAVAVGLSLLRGVFVDPPVVITDGYDYFAGQLGMLLSDWNYNIDESLVRYQFPIRVLYSLIVAVLNVST
ncbi:MAG: hypothetical protein RTU09_11260, partial [Candidatus Thorarchaeota archaeon]